MTKIASSAALRYLRVAALSSVALTLAGCATGPAGTWPATAETQPSSALPAAGSPSDAAAAVATSGARPPDAPSADAPVHERTGSSATLADASNPAPTNDTALAARLRRAELEPLPEAELRTLWHRIRLNYAMPDLDGELVRKWEQWYATRPDYVARMTERGGRYLFHVVEEAERRGVPSELALLPFIESAFNPEAMSRARASGMWQFMPATGKDFALRQNVFRDDRRGVLTSTRAAFDYLVKLHAQFSDWRLALAAYNWGQGNVSRAIERNRRAGLGVAYEDLSMPDETRNYVPKLQAVKNIVARPEEFGLTLSSLGNRPAFIGVAITRDIDVALAARLAGLSLAEFRQLNPQMNKPVILAAGTPEVLLPHDNANRFIRELARHRGPTATWTAWQAPRTLKPAEAARLTGMPENELREINTIPPRMLVQVGSTLIVPRADSAADVSDHLADHAMIALAPEPRPMRRVTVRAGRKGESVAAVAARLGVAAGQLALWNKVAPQAAFKPGQPVTVMLPAARPGAPALRATAKSVTKAGASVATRSAKPAPGHRPTRR